MTPALQPSTIQKIGHEFAIAWSDGVETYLPLEFLRRHCPCAACNGEPDVTGRVVRPSTSLNEKSFDLASWQAVGGYAIQPKWGDGHSTGIYSYDLLRRLAAMAG
jgi:DUF971 family protein